MIKNYLFKFALLFLTIMSVMIVIALVLIIGAYVITFEFESTTNAIINILKGDWQTVRVITYILFLLSLVFANAFVDDEDLGEIKEFFNIE